MSEIPTEVVDVQLVQLGPVVEVAEKVWQRMIRLVLADGSERHLALQGPRWSLTVVWLGRGVRPPNARSPRLSGAERRLRHQAEGRLGRPMGMAVGVPAVAGPVVPVPPSPEEYLLYHWCEAGAPAR